MFWSTSIAYHNDPSCGPSKLAFVGCCKLLAPKTIWGCFRFAIFTEQPNLLPTKQSNLFKQVSSFHKTIGFFVLVKLATSLRRSCSGSRLMQTNAQLHCIIVTCRQVLPSITPGNIWNSELLDALTEANNLGIFQSEVVEAVISAVWEQMRAYTALDIGARLLTVIVSWPKRGSRATQRHQNRAFCLLYSFRT